MQFAPEVSVAKGQRRRFFVPPFCYDSWRAKISDGLVEMLCVDERRVAVGEAVRVGSLDPGSVSFGWGVVEFAPLAASLGPPSDSSQQGLAGQPRQAEQPRLAGRGRWIRVPRPSKEKNCVDASRLPLGATEPYDTLDYAFRLVEWNFESMCETKKKLTKEQAVGLAVPMFAKFLANMRAHHVQHVVIEQQLGMQNMMTTCLAHVF
jgi:hypothetical protein